MCFLKLTKFINWFNDDFLASFEQTPINKNKSKIIDYELTNIVIDKQNENEIVKKKRSNTHDDWDVL